MLDGTFFLSTNSVVSTVNGAARFTPKQRRLRHARELAEGVMGDFQTEIPLATEPEDSAVSRFESFLGIANAVGAALLV